MKTVSTWTSGGWCDASHIFCFSCFSELLTFKMALILLCLAIIGPPVISLSGYENYLNISISLPVETTITDQMRQFYKSVSFNISWKKAGQSEVFVSAQKVTVVAKSYFSTKSCYTASQRGSADTNFCESDKSTSNSITRICPYLRALCVSYLFVNKFHFVSIIQKVALQLFQYLTNTNLYLTNSL